MSYTLEFEIKGLPKTTNAMAGAHWTKRHLHAKRWKRAVWLAVYLKLPNAPLKRAVLTLTRCSSRESDFDGCVSGFKHVIDGLVEAGVIENDRQENIGQPTYKQERAKPFHGSIKVKIESAIANKSSLK